METLFGHTSEDTALVVDDYPYGRQRTQIRYWIETVAKRGDRFVSQTLNPKTGRWNKPKKSTYMPVMVMTRAEDVAEGKGIVKTSYTGLSQYADADKMGEFLKLATPANLNDEQRKQVASLKAWSKVLANVTWTVREGERTEAEKQEQDEIKRTLSRAAAVETHRNLQEMA